MAATMVPETMGRQTGSPTSRTILRLLVFATAGATVVAGRHVQHDTWRRENSVSLQTSSKAPPSGARDLFQTSITQDELDYCLAHLEQVAIDSHVGEAEFLLFLENISAQPLEFDEFHELPLELVLVFYTAACTGGRNCSTEKARISLLGVGGGASKAFLRIFCASVKEVAVVQIVYEFQYQLMLDSFVIQKRSSSAKGLLDQDTLSRNLEKVTQLVLMDDLGCVDSNKKGPRSRRALRGQSLLGNRRKMNMKTGPATDSKEDCDLPPLEDQTVIGQGRKLDLLGNQNCGFSVQVRVDDSQQMQCLSTVQHSNLHQQDSIGPEQSDMCLLVFSQIKVTAVSLFQELSQPELRTLVATAMKEAILGDEFNKYLAEENLGGSR